MYYNYELTICNYVTALNIKMMTNLCSYGIEYRTKPFSFCLMQELYVSHNTTNTFRIKIPTISLKSIQLFTEHFSICCIEEIVTAHSAPCTVDTYLQCSLSSCLIWIISEVSQSHLPTLTLCCLSRGSCNENVFVFQL